VFVPGSEMREGHGAIALRVTTEPSEQVETIMPTNTAFLRAYWTLNKIDNPSLREYSHAVFKPAIDVS